MKNIPTYDQFVNEASKYAKFGLTEEAKAKLKQLGFRAFTKEDGYAYSGAGDDAHRLELDHSDVVISIDNGTIYCQQMFDASSDLAMITCTDDEALALASRAKENDKKFGTWLKQNYDSDQIEDLNLGSGDWQSIDQFVKRNLH